MPDWLLPLAALLFAVASPFLAWYGSSRYFAGHVEQRLRENERRVEALEKANAAGAETRQNNAVRLESMSGQLEYLLTTVGKDGRTGLRGDLHGLRGEWTPILIRLQTLMEQRE